MTETIWTTRKPLAERIVEPAPSAFAARTDGPPKARLEARRAGCSGGTDFTRSNVMHECAPARDEDTARDRREP